MKFSEAAITLTAPERAITREDSDAMFAANHDVNVLMRHSDADGVTFAVDLQDCREVGEGFVHDIFCSLSKPRCEWIAVNLSASSLGGDVRKIFVDKAEEFSVPLFIE